MRGWQIFPRQSRRDRSAALVFLVWLVGLTSWGRGTCLAGEAEDKLKNLFNVRLDDSRVTVQVLPLPENRLAVVLTGQVDTEGEKNLLERVADQTKPPSPTSAVC